MKTFLVQRKSNINLLMLALCAYEFVFAWDGGIRRFCPLIFNVRGWDTPPVVVQLVVFVLYTGERRCGLVVEFVDVVIIDVFPPATVVVDELLLSDGCNTHGVAKQKIKQ